MYVRIMCLPGMSAIFSYYAFPYSEPEGCNAINVIREKECLIDMKNVGYRNPHFSKRIQIQNTENRFKIFFLIFTFLIKIKQISDCNNQFSLC